jgi:hypothetical protein
MVELVSVLVRLLEVKVETAWVALVALKSALSLIVPVLLVHLIARHWVETKVITDTVEEIDELNELSDRFVSEHIDAEASYAQLGDPIILFIL